jgi:hypothetical protein
MKDSINPNTIANQVRMAASHHRGSFLLVEGDTDARIFKGFVDKSACLVIVGYNKDNVLQAVELLLKKGPKGIVAIVDSDFWLLDKKNPPRDCIFATDSHDLETMMLQTEALSKVLRELASKEKIKKFEYSTSSTVCDSLVKVGLPIGLFRWISHRDGLALKFKDINFTLFINIKSLSLDINQLVRTVIDNTVSPKVSDDSLKKKIYQEQKTITHIDKWQICSGHDLINILSIGLQRSIGNRKPKEVTREILERHFRLAYEYEFFKMSLLWKSLRIWEMKNPIYKLLRD